MRKTNKLLQFAITTLLLLAGDFALANTPRLHCPECRRDNTADIAAFGINSAFHDPSGPLSRSDRGRFQVRNGAGQLFTAQIKAENALTLQVSIGGRNVSISIPINFVSAIHFTVEVYDEDGRLLDRFIKDITEGPDDVGEGGSSSGSQSGSSSSGQSISTGVLSNLLQYYSGGYGTPYQAPGESKGPRQTCHWRDASGDIQVCSTY